MKNRVRIHIQNLFQPLNSSIASKTNGRLPTQSTLTMTMKWRQGCMMQSGIASRLKLVSWSHHSPQYHCSDMRSFDRIVALEAKMIVFRSFHRKQRCFVLRNSEVMFCSDPWTTLTLFDSDPWTSLTPEELWPLNLCFSQTTLTPEWFWPLNDYDSWTTLTP